MVGQAIEKLREQQKNVKQYSAQWMVAEQLMDICRQEPHCAELICQDLENQSMSIVEAEKQIKALADKRKEGNSSCVSPREAEEVLREFYGLPKPEEERPAQGCGIAINLADFLG